MRGTEEPTAPSFGKHPVNCRSCLATETPDLPSTVSVLIPSPRWRLCESAARPPPATWRDERRRCGPRGQLGSLFGCDFVRLALDDLDEVNLGVESLSLAVARLRPNGPRVYTNTRTDFCRIGSKRFAGWRTEGKKTKLQTAVNEGLSRALAGVVAGCRMVRAAGFEPATPSV